MNRLLATASTCLVATVSIQAAAAARLSTQLSANRVEVGQQFTLQLSCMVDAGAGTPSDPRLTVPRGVSAQGPGISTQQNVSIINGQMQQQSGVVSTWVLVAGAPGRYRIGPASIAVGGQRQSDRAVEVEVVAKGSLPQANRSSRRTRGFDPFDPFGGSDPFSGPMFPPGVNLLPQPSVDEIPSYPPDLNIDKPRDPLAFLDARISSKRLVVGEQATLRIYAYGKPGPFELMLSSEPKRDDFLSYQNERDNPIGPLYRIKTDSEIWFARKILSYALFPTKSGHLRIGPAEANFAGAGLLGGNSYRNIQRQSQPLEIVVEEPPLTGRPAGYHIGDVGNFTLTANVEPRRINAHESVSVQVEVAGVGQLPQRLDPPEQTGVDWLEPSTTQQVDDQREKIAGRRQFTYVVRIERAGSIDLGTLRFPYFDPTTRKYAVASATLGSIEVIPTPAAAAGNGLTPTNAVVSDDPLLAALHPRQKLTATGTPPRYLAERTGFYWWLVAGPLFSLALVGLRALRGRWSSWRERSSSSARVLLETELKAAQASLRAGDAHGVATRLERLLHLLIEYATGLKSRAILRAELSIQMQARAVDGATAERLVAMLELCDNLKFVQPNIEEAAAALAESTALVAALQPLLNHKQRRAG